MKILFNNKLGLIFILLFSLSAKAEFRLGVDYTMVSNPMPVKQDGVVEVMESFFGMVAMLAIHLNHQLMHGLRNKIQM